MLRSSLRLLFCAGSAVALLACSSDMTSSTSTGSGGGSTSSATGTGTTTGGTGGSSTTSTSSGTATSSGTGAGPMNACTNAADAAAITAKDIKAIVTKCGQDNAGAEPATRNCIKMGAGLSDDCTGCYSGEVDCIHDHCLAPEGHCLIAPDAQLCTDCRKMYCTANYEACSGNKSM